MKLRYILLLAAATIFIGWNKYQYNRSFDHCEQLLSENRRCLQILHNEILTLQAAMTGVEVDYE